MDFEWIKDVICFTKQAGWMDKSKVVPDYKLEHTNKELDGRLTSLLLLARFFSSALILLCDRVHLPNVLFHSFACIIIPSTWCFRFDSLPYSLASHASMIFLQNKALDAPHACPCMWFDKMLKGRPMMYHGACMVRLTRLPPSKHALMLSTPLISKIKNNSELWESSNINLEKFLNH
jgi:hypothetical protein